MRVLPLLALAPLALLSACDGGGADDTRTASGEVLEGTISDAMLPLDTVRSQPPLAKNTGAPGEDGATPAATDAALDAETATQSEGEAEAPAGDET